jgi:hypothetical protein
MLMVSVSHHIRTLRKTMEKGREQTTLYRAVHRKKGKKENMVRPTSLVKITALRCQSSKEGKKARRRNRFMEEWNVQRNWTSIVKINQREIVAFAKGCSYCEK